MTNLVQIKDNKAITTSNDIALAFSKRHHHIVRDIEALEIPEDFQKTNFGLLFREVKIGNGAVRQYKSYEITRDGFTLLAMGFTGKKAMEFKIKYIEAFNAMEKALTSPNTDLIEVKPFLRRKPTGKKEIVLSEKARHELGGIVKAVVNKALDDRLNSFLQPDMFEQPQIEADPNDVIRNGWYNISDKEMLDYLQRWYGTKNYNTLKALHDSVDKIEQLECKLRMVQKAVA